MAAFDERAGGAPATSGRSCRTQAYGARRRATRRSRRCPWSPPPKPQTNIRQAVRAGAGIGQRRHPDVGGPDVTGGLLAAAQEHCAKHGTPSSSCTNSASTSRIDGPSRCTVVRTSQRCDRGGPQQVDREPGRLAVGTATRPFDGAGRIPPTTWPLMVGPHGPLGHRVGISTPSATKQPAPPPAWVWFRRGSPQRRGVISQPHRRPDEPLGVVGGGSTMSSKSEVFVQVVGPPSLQTGDDPPFAEAGGGEAPPRPGWSPAAAP